MTLAVSGRLWRDALIMFDRATRSLWSQILGEAVAGPLTGQKLTEIPSQVTSWRSWRERHPDTLVLEKPRLDGSVYDDYSRDPRRIGVVGSGNPDPRLPVKSLVFALELEAGPLAIPFATLADRPVLALAHGGAQIVVFSPPGEATALAYERVLDGRSLTFAAVPDKDAFAVRDRETGSHWAWETGEAVAGELAGKRLTPLGGVAVYWGVWARYHPSTALVLAK